MPLRSCYLFAYARLARSVHCMQPCCENYGNGVDGFISQPDERGKLVLARLEKCFPLQVIGMSMFHPLPGSKEWRGSLEQGQLLVST